MLFFSKETLLCSFFQSTYFFEILFFECSIFSHILSVRLISCLFVGLYLNLLLRSLSIVVFTRVYLNVLRDFRPKLFFSIYLLNLSSKTHYTLSALHCKSFSGNHSMSSCPNGNAVCKRCGITIKGHLQECASRRQNNCQTKKHGQIDQAN